MDELLNLAKRLADYVRMTIEIGGLESDSLLGIAHRDFIEEWDKRHLVPTVPDEAGLGMCPKCGSDALMCAACDYPCDEHLEV